MLTLCTNPAEASEFAGVLAIGDPHVCSKRPGRRKDDYLGSVLEKLSACAALCQEHNLRPVILGDLLHLHSDNSLRMLNRLMLVLQSFPRPPLVLDGNHDRDGKELDEDDALQLLANANAIVVPAPGLAEVIRVRGQLVEIWAAPHGTPIPSKLTSSTKSAVRLLLTHHDLAFGQSYPGALALKPIEGCALVINGHMHDTKPAVQQGGTYWHNPGNIEPLSVDLKDHQPAAWLWEPGTPPGSLVKLPLPHNPDVFDLTGLLVDAAPAAQAVAALSAIPVTTPAVGKFAAEIDRQGGEEAHRTADASVLREDARQVLDARDAPPAVRAMLELLLDKVAARAEA